ncbi:MAG TPA: helix-turn-helix transcriptional regulator [Lysobacter sp.]|jgi:AraC-like DNA-binding protein|nr:helix-turn-helix transcriptional regulator [Lysobacter sp.]
MTAIGCFETRHQRDELLPTHRHGSAYAALVLDGSHLEASVDGIFDCEPGTLILHPRFHAHGNRFGNLGARVVNIALPDDLAADSLRALRVHHLGDASELVERNPQALSSLIAAAQLLPSSPLPDWQPILLEQLRTTDAPIGDLCRHLGVSAAHASRALLRSHGMSPQLLRRELRWRRALALLHGNDSLADVAMQSGFADQSHLTRIARLHTGLPPAALRRQIKSVQDPAES